SGGLARLPDAAQDQFPLPRQHSGGTHCARRRPLHGSCETRRHARHPGMARASRSGRRGVQEWLSFYFKSPVRAAGLYPEHDLFIQLMKLKNTLRYLRGEELITYLGIEYSDYVLCSPSV